MHQVNRESHLVTKGDSKMGVVPVAKKFGSSAFFFLPNCSELGLSLQADRSKRLRFLQLMRRFVFEVRLKASKGTDVMPVLSQMILDKLAEARAVLCLMVKTPGFSNQNLKISNKHEKGLD